MSYNFHVHELIDSVKGFRLPLYSEIPDVGLYLDQVSKYITECFAPLDQPGLTGSMISNYVKQKLVPNPIKKLYYRDQIATLIFITIAKNTLSISQIKALLENQQITCSSESTYNYFLNEFETVFHHIFNVSGNVIAESTEYAVQPVISSDDIHEEQLDKSILRSLLLIFSYKVYLDKIISISDTAESE